MNFHLNTKLSSIIPNIKKWNFSFHPIGMKKMANLARILEHGGRVTYTDSNYCEDYNLCTIYFKYSESEVGYITFDFMENTYYVFNNIRSEDELLLVKTLRKFGMFVSKIYSPTQKMICV